MNLSLAAFRAAVAATVLWAAKAVAIGLAGGLGRSPLEGPLFLLGLAGAVLASLLAGASYVVRRGRAWKVLGAFAGVVVVSAFGTAEGALVAAVTPAHPGWVWGELNLWVLAVALVLATGWRLRRPTRHGRPETRNLPVGADRSVTR